MPRISLAAALLLGLGAAPAFAQSGDATPDSPSRTLLQNQRAFIPDPPTTQMAQDAKPAPMAKDRQAQTGPTVRPGRRVVLADRTAR